MPLRPSKKGHKYVASIEIKGPVENRRAFRAFRSALAKHVKKLKGKLKQRRTGR